MNVREEIKEARISTHSPRAGRTGFAIVQINGSDIFQLTRPVRGEPNLPFWNSKEYVISTHSPRAGRTLPCNVVSTFAKGFQLTRPVRGEPEQVLSRLYRQLQFQLTRPVRGEP